jgi:hypothetical protein
MSQRMRRISARAAENLLSGVPVDSPNPRLAAVLRAAAGPTRPAELAGRQLAVAAFHHALLHPAETSEKRSMIRTAALKLFTVKAAAVAAVVLGTGGVALAASTGAIPTPLNNHHPVPSASVTTPQPGDRPQSSAHPGNADPSPSLVGLCRAYTAGAGADHGAALASPAFQALITAAGGKDGVDAFCAKVLATAGPSQNPDAQPSDRPSHPDHPSHPAHPTDKPSAHPSG